MSDPVLILPGFGNSGPQHWQSLWQQSSPEFERVQQRDWNNPVCDAWVDALETAARRAGPGAVLVAHSLACLVIAHWAAQAHAPIKGALMVAVPDPAEPVFPLEAMGFDVTPTQPFSFPSIVVASTDDSYASVEYTARLSRAWGSRFVSIGARGHINASSGLETWAEGYELLSQLRGSQEVRPGADRCASPIPGAIHMLGV